jgi:hypothetical protein
MMHVYLESLSVIAPGLAGWDKSRAILAGDSEYQAGPLLPFSPDILPVNERRRITPTIRIALQAATEALQASNHTPNELISVFSSNNGDLDISERICSALSQPEFPVSPTDFHNSVHNAPAGYWAIGSQCHLPSTSISAGRASFVAGLLEAVTQALCCPQPVLLVCYELPAPDSLSELWNVDQPFAVGLLVQKSQSPTSLGKLSMKLADAGDTGTDIRNPALRPLLNGNSAAQCLPLLETFAIGKADSCRIPYLDNRHLMVEFSPC